MEIKNLKEINKLKSELKHLNSDIDFGSFSISLTLSSVDTLISKLKEQEKLHSIWSDKIKKTRLKSIKDELSYLNAQIKAETETLNKERTLLSKVNVSELNSDYAPDVMFYDNTKKWVTTTLRNLEKLNARFLSLSDEYVLLNNESTVFYFDTKGNIVHKKDQRDEIINSINLHITNNLNILMSKEKLKKLLYVENEDEDDF